MRVIVIQPQKLNARIAGHFQAHVTSAVRGVETCPNDLTGSRREVRAGGEINAKPSRVTRVKSDGKMVRRIRFN